jgi:ATP-dependent DNA helicase RecG
MSRFRSVAQAIRAPLAFVREHPERLERLGSAPETLRAALARGVTLRIPPAARTLFGDALGWLGAEPFSVALAERIAARIDPLLALDYPVRILAQPTERIPRVGPKLAASLARRELHTVEDLLFFWPRAYEDRRGLLRIEDARVGRLACFEARIARAHRQRLRNGRSVFEAVVSDATGALSLKWFRAAVPLEERLVPGARLLVAGEVRRYRYAKEIHHPEIELLGDDVALDSLPRIVPLYAQIDGVPPRTLRRIVEGAVAYAADLVDGLLPEGSVRALGLPEIGASVAGVHLPEVHLEPQELDARATGYHRRLAAEELLLLLAGLELRREHVAAQLTRPLRVEDPRVAAALAALPFQLTSDQDKAWRAIASDLARPRPMNRLVLGDVGTGKTVLALLASVAAQASGGLTALLAPTEVLARQHFRTFEALGAPLGLRVALLTGRTPAGERRALGRALRAGAVSTLIGTHALLSDSLELPELRLVVIDEQHRFGVAQRAALGRKGERPHLLVMTATPIPRTLAMAVFGDLDHCELRERPAGRPPVATRVVPTEQGRAVLEEMRAAILRREQVYVVYPLVEESAKQDLLDATRGFERLQRNLPEARMALVHGRQEPRARAKVMEAFARRELDLLVATTVVEVGVDAPGATLMVVRHAERFGLAQLHQLRGRVGRGERPGQALLISDASGEGASRRLAVLESTSSGFEIAEEDLRMRGAGEWLGTRQSGLPAELKLADLVRHADLLPLVREAAGRLVEADPGLARHPELRAAIERRWGARLSFAATA